ncbi:melanoma-associated antigen E1-like [Magallana gigas]|uniref:melanoma-associated antigen E1-like n=1 Tax=Magallana gigas TaxID=29159 RepID=UPI0033418DDA
MAQATNKRNFDEVDIEDFTAAVKRLAISPPGYTSACGKNLNGSKHSSSKELQGKSMSRTSMIKKQARQADSLKHGQSRTPSKDPTFIIQLDDQISSLLKLDCATQPSNSGSSAIPKISKSTSSADRGKVSGKWQARIQDSRQARAKRARPYTPRRTAGNTNTRSNVTDQQVDHLTARMNALRTAITASGSLQTFTTPLNTMGPTTTQPGPASSAPQTLATVINSVRKATTQPGPASSVPQTLAAAITSTGPATTQPGPASSVPQTLAAAITSTGPATKQPGSASSVPQTLATAINSVRQAITQQGSASSVPQTLATAINSVRQATTQQGPATSAPQTLATAITSKGSISTTQPGPASGVPQTLATAVTSTGPATTQPGPAPSAPQTLATVINSVRQATTQQGPAPSAPQTLATAINYVGQAATQPGHASGAMKNNQYVHCRSNVTQGIQASSQKNNDHHSKRRQSRKRHAGFFRDDAPKRPRHAHDEGFRLQLQLLTQNFANLSL